MLRCCASFPASRVLLGMPRRGRAVYDERRRRDKTVRDDMVSASQGPRALITMLGSGKRRRVFDD